MSQPEGHRGDEQVLWSGAPDTSVVFTAWDVFLVPFSFAWTAVAVYSTLIAPPGISTLVGAVMFAFGIYLIAGRFVAKVYIKRRTTYRVTSGQAVISGPRKTYKIDLETGDVTVKIRQQRRERGRVTFTSSKPRLSSVSVFRTPMVNTGLDIALVPGVDVPFAFYDVPMDPDLSVVLRRLSLGTSQRDRPLR